MGAVAATGALVAGASWEPHLPGWRVALAVAVLVGLGTVLVTTGLGEWLQRDAQRRGVPRASESARAVRLAGWLIILLGLFSLITNSTLGGT